MMRWCRGVYVHLHFPPKKNLCYNLCVCNNMQINEATETLSSCSLTLETKEGEMQSSTKLHLQVKRF